MRLALLVVAFVLSTACSNIRVRTDWDPSTVDATYAYKTYSWLPNPTGDTRIYNAVVESRVHTAVDTYLAERGYQRVDKEGDFNVGWHADIDTKMDVNTVNSYYGYGYGNWYGGPGGWSSDTYVTTWDEGTLVIDITDAKTNQLVWRGAAIAEIHHQKDPEKRQKRINGAVAKVLAEFPAPR